MQPRLEVDHRNKTGALVAVDGQGGVVGRRAQGAGDRGSSGTLRLGDPPTGQEEVPDLGALTKTGTAPEEVEAGA